jgi:hypothetical protein
MRKTLLIAAAALACSVISSEAQVYSLNIVGYVNIPAKIGYNNIANPLDCGNSLTNIVPPGPTWDYTLVDIWTGSGYAIYTIDSSMSTGVSDANDVNPVTAPTIKPGQAFFFINNTVSSNTLTIAGTVHTDLAATGSQVVGTSTNKLGLSPTLNFYGSVFPIGGTLGSVGFPTNGPLDYALVSIPQINSGGSLTGFKIYTVDSSLGGWSDANDVLPVADPALPVGVGFFFNNNTGSAYYWTQTL